MKKFTKALAASALIGGAVFAAPMAANAATNPSYPPTTITNEGNLIQITVAPGGSFTIVFPAGTFAANVFISVTFSSTGPVPTNGAVAVFHAATATATGTTAADGSATVTGTVPTDASAPITVTAATATREAEATIDIASTVPAAATTTTSSTSGLATTGTYISLATVWGAVGLVALGGGVVGVTQLRRKRERSKA